jgi:alpha-beta hydrolase superfamily lysophospholipase
MNHTVNHDQGRVQTADDLGLAWRAWVPETPRGLLAIVHGLAEHSGRYDETASVFARAGWAVYAVDLRAHGHSDNPPKAGRVHVRKFEDYFLDVDAVIALARQRHPGLPQLLLGHSMGGLIVIRYALARGDELSGIVVSSPALGTHPDFRPPWLLRMLVGLLSHVAPRLRVPSDLDVDAISRDPDVVRAYRDDPLVSDKVSSRWYAEILKSMRTAMEAAPGLRVPMLLMQSGADRLVDPEAPRRWSRAAPPEWVELIIWDGLYHEMFNEPEKARVRERVLAWLDEQTAAEAR